MLAYLVRHAESLGNVADAAGLNDGLSDLGRRQAEALAQRLSPAGIRGIYSSPFRRAIETALPLAGRLRIRIRIRPELCEHHHLPDAADLGVPEIDRLVREFPQAVPCPDHDGAYAWPPGDEPFGDLLVRARAFASYLKERWAEPDDVVAVFGHGSPIARLIEAWLTYQPGPSFRFVIDNGTISAVRYFDGVSSLVCLNEASHLRGLAAPAGANFSEEGVFRPRPATAPW